MQVLKSSTGAIALALIAGCGGGGSATGSGAAITGGVMKGPVLAATVCVYQLNGGAKGAQVPVTLASGASGAINAGCYVTAADGAYSFNLPAGTTGDVLIEATGGSFCSNEVPIVANACAGGGTVVNLGGAVMTSAVAVPASGAATIYTTPLTTAAVNAAAGASFTAASFNTQFNTLAGQIMGAGSGVTPATLPTPANQPYLAQVATFMQGGGSLNNAVGGLQQGTTNFTSGAGTTSPATVNAQFVGTRTLVFSADGAGCGTVCNYTDGQSVSVTVTANNELVLPHKTLSNPFHRHYGGQAHLPEIIWLDAESNVEYALSDNSTGSFNEINVGDASNPQNASGIPGFIGQLREPANNNLTVLAPFVGTHQAAYQYKGSNVAWTSVTIGADGAITFNGGAGPNVTAAQIVEVYDRLNCCGRVDVQVNFEMNTPANGIDGQDKISLYRDNNGNLRSIEYDPGHVFSLSDDIGVRLGTVNALPAHDGTAIPGTNTISATFGATPLSFAVHPESSSNQFSFTLEGRGTGVIPAMLQVRVDPATGNVVPGTYACRTGPNEETSVSVRTAANGTLLQTKDGGRCSVTVTHYQAGGTNTKAEIEGTFVAELVGVSQGNAPVTMVNGVFRYYEP